MTNVNEALDEMLFLSDCVSKCKQNPHLFGKIVMACTHGIEEAIEEERRRATDMETIAIAYANIAGEKRSLAKTKEWATSLIINKLNNWKHLNAFVWDENIERLEYEATQSEPHP